MSNLGLGVMIQALRGDEDSVKAFSESVNKVIADLVLTSGDELLFTFTDGAKMRISDEGLPCCECRYMNTDDELKDFIGSTLLDAETASAPNIEDDSKVHEVQFLHIKTSKGVFTMQTHNEHNGYYGGFWVVAAKVE